MDRTRILLTLAAVVVVTGLVFAWHQHALRTGVAPVPAPRIVSPAMQPPGVLATPPATPPAAQSVAPTADCLLPGPPPVAPDGRAASLADMKLGQTAIQNFVLQLEAYQACRDSQADHALPGTSAAQKDDWIKQGDDAVDEAHALADAFSAQLKIFNARGGSQAH
jgi:hypothetical protein